MISWNLFFRQELYKSVIWEGEQKLRKENLKLLTNRVAKDIYKDAVSHDPWNHRLIEIKQHMAPLIRVIKEQRKEIERLNAKNDSYLTQLADCREQLLPLMENYKDYEELLGLTVSDPMSVSYLCERVADEFHQLK